MVKGLGVFNRHFRPFSDQYVLIGGVACDLALEDAGVDFRVTKDLDIVLCAEALTSDFVQAFWGFIIAGGYKVQEKSGGERQFYRFKNPSADGYPAMLELFSRVPDVLDIVDGQHLAPISVNEQAVSLSAILLKPDLYDWIMRGRMILDGVPVVSPMHLIPLKAKAWLDLSARKLELGNVDSRDINKHKNDALRLVALLVPGPVPSMPDSIRDDLRRFVVAMDGQLIDCKALGLGRRTKSDVLTILRTTYGL